MRRILLWLAFAGTLAISLASMAQVRGTYMETRTADVYTGMCFANGEVNLTGNEAVMAWHINKGTWHGVKLDGLTIAAALHAQATLGDPYANPYPVKSVLMVDDQATPAQQKALVDFAKHQAGKLLSEVVAVHREPVIMEVAEGRMEGYARMQAGMMAAIGTRPIDAMDRICGNEYDFYPPLAKNIHHAETAVALTDSYSGPGLSDRWSVSGKRSAYIGTFNTGTSMMAAKE